MSVLAIDYGEKKTGFAVSDPDRILVQPLAAVRMAGEGGRLLEHVATLLEERRVSTLLVGIPLLKHDEEGAQAQAVRAFMRRLGARFPELEVCAYDEHLTTKEAESRLRELGYHGREIAARKDSWSAKVLLEDWIHSGEPRERSRRQASE